MSVTRKTIFLVDDSKSNLTVGKETLSGFYTVFTINSGAQLFRMLENRIPDLILLDIDMPEMDGYEVMSRIKKNVRTSRVPVIFLTALNNEETEFKGLSLGAVDYITKPFSPPLLRIRIELHLQLIDYRKHLEIKVEEKTKEVTALKNAVLKIASELVEYRDENTGTHIDRTQRYMKILLESAREHGIYTSELARLDENLVLQSCQLHDVGKITIRDSILLKPGKLTGEEFEEMKKHTTVGGDIITRAMKATPGSGEFLEYARVFAVSHHEKWDGSGYPKGLKGEEIPLLGRLMAIADVYDALVSDRPYKSAYSHNEAVAIVKDETGTHFDPALGELFLYSNREFEAVKNEMSGDDTPQNEALNPLPRNQSCQV